MTVANLGLSRHLATHGNIHEAGVKVGQDVVMGLHVPVGVGIGRGLQTAQRLVGNADRLLNIIRVHSLVDGLQAAINKEVVEDDGHG